MPALVVHGHFYQPPRENPWTGVVEEQTGAAPFHDWNERIHAECYGPNASAIIADPVSGEPREINNYENISFNFGPTLLSWLQQHHPGTYTRIIEADRKSVLKHNGHGNAIAQAYGHAILPLCNERDRQTQIVWAIEDFRFRFQREPESLWLPETGCDNATLDALIEHGLRYAILAPKQAQRIRRSSNSEWVSVADGSIDTSRAYRYLHRDGSLRSIAVFFYDGALSHALAFENILVSSERLMHFVSQRADGRNGLVTAAIDGETYGHHFKFGDLCLAYALEVEAPKHGFAISNFGEFLDLHPPDFEVEIKAGPDGEGTACSCAHGLGRWTRDCGCHTGGQDGWNQAWRSPLRAALNFLRAEAARHYEIGSADLLRDRWRARNGYIHLLLNPGESQTQFLSNHWRRPLSPTEQERAIALLEMERNALLMFTSCGWFFNDLAGVETIQILRYAARVVELLAQNDSPSPRKQFLEILSAARSNIAELGNGAEIYLRLAERPTSKIGV